MATFYKGAGPLTYHERINAMNSGMSPVAPVVPPGRDRIIDHIRQGPKFPQSPYISLTRSYTVAYDYALVGRHPASASNPGYVYHIDLPDPLPSYLTVIDPVKEIAAGLPGPTTNSTYKHDGWPSLLHGVIDPRRHAHELMRRVRLPGGNLGGPANVTRDLVAMSFALRDAEVLVLGSLHNGWFVDREPIS